MNLQPAHQAGAPPADQQPALAGDHRWHPAILMELINSLGDHFPEFQKLSLKTEGSTEVDQCEELKSLYC